MASSLFPNVFIWKFQIFSFSGRESRRVFFFFNIGFIIYSICAFKGILSSEIFGLR